MRSSSWSGLRILVHETSMVGKQDASSQPNRGRMTRRVTVNLPAAGIAWHSSCGAYGGEGGRARSFHQLQNTIVRMVGSLPRGSLTVQVARIDGVHESIYQGGKEDPSLGASASDAVGPQTPSTPDCHCVDRYDWSSGMASVTRDWRMLRAPLDHRSDPNPVYPALGSVRSPKHSIPSRHD